MPNSNSSTSRTLLETAPETSIIFIGRTNSGKTTAGRFLQRYSDSGIHIEASSVLANILENKNQNMTREAIRQYMEKTNKKGVVEKISDNIQNNTEPNIFITGLRSPTEVEYIQNNMERTWIIGIKAPQKVRLQRAIENSKSTRSTAKHQFKMKEKLDEELGITKTIKKYPIKTITNNESITRFYDELSVLYDRIVEGRSVGNHNSYAQRKV